MELVPVPLVPTCPTKWVYKTVEDLCLVNVSVKYFSKLCFGTIKIQPELKYLKPILEDFTS